MVLFCAHGKTSAAVAGEVFLCIVNLTYLNAELSATNGKLLGEAGAYIGDYPLFVLPPLVLAGVSHSRLALSSFDFAVPVTILLAPIHLSSLATALSFDI